MESEQLQVGAATGTQAVMIEPELVRQIRALEAMAWGSKRIARELGYLPLERASAHVFFQLVTRRYERGSILLTTNQPVTEWGRVFGDDMIAAAVLDRLLHHSHTLVVTGESYRLKQQKRAGLLAPSRKG
jgi:hypothetical protein